MYHINIHIFCLHIYHNTPQRPRGMSLLRIEGWIATAHRARDARTERIIHLAARHGNCYPLVQHNELEKSPM